MKFNLESSDEHVKLYNNIVLREKSEKQAAGTVTSEILSKLNISVETLPQKTQHILNQVASNQAALNIDKLDSLTLSLRQSREQSELLEDEYEILKLKQKNAELQAKIDRNKRFLEELRKDLACSKECLASQKLNPDNIEDNIRKWKQKVASYEESCEKAKLNFSKLSVPENIYPLSLASLVVKRDELRHDAESLRLQADDIALVREARNVFTRLRK